MIFCGFANYSTNPIFSLWIVNGENIGEYNFKQGKTKLILKMTVHFQSNQIEIFFYQITCVKWAGSWALFGRLQMFPLLSITWAIPCQQRPTATLSTCKWYQIQTIQRKFRNRWSDEGDTRNDNIIPDLTNG